MGKISKTPLFRDLNVLPKIEAESKVFQRITVSAIDKDFTVNDEQRGAFISFSKEFCEKLYFNIFCIHFLNAPKMRSTDI